MNYKTKMQLKRLNRKTIRPIQLLIKRKYITIIVFVLSFLIGVLIGITIFKPKDIKVTPRPCEIVNFTIVRSEVENYKSDPLTYIRFRGQELGFDDYTISKFIRVARCESGFELNQNAKNKVSSASGIYQIIIGTWNSNKCNGERLNFLDNIDCGYKLLESRGFQPWISSSKCWNN